MKLETTLLLLRKDDQILLAMKKRRFGVGKYNGVGGKLQESETPEMAMLRETKEEINVVPTKYEKDVKGEKTNLIFHLYIAIEWEGTPNESEEMKPQWFSISDIPYDSMF